MIYYTECKPDSALVRTLGIHKKEIIHLGGKPNVCKRLEKRENCRGLIDEDPFSVQPPYLKKLQMKDDLSGYGLKILNDNYRSNVLILLCPRLEEWVLKAVKEAEIDIQKYNLADDGERLHKEINININKFEKLIIDLKVKSKMMKALEKSIKDRRQK